MAVLDIQQTLLSAATTGHGTAVDLGGQTESILVYLEGSSGISAGKVQVETAPTTDYAGTWAAIGSEQTLVASTVLTVAATGPFLAVRARITTDVEGGPVTATLVGQSSAGC
jgi:ABC-type phosphate/phosphonate transport system substrate-binding protein